MEFGDFALKFLAEVELADDKEGYWLCSCATESATVITR